MKLIIRGDDVGYSPVCNIGSFEAIAKGIVTSADVMLDTPGTEDALLRLRDFPWISVGWHTHFWGSPVLSPEKLPTLYDPDREGFRQDIDSDEVDYEEALSECRAQLERCIDLLGKVPDVGDVMYSKTSKFGRALLQVMDEYHIVHDFMGVDLGGPLISRSDPVYLPDKKWQDRKIFCRGLLQACAPLRAQPTAENGFTDSIRALQSYDPIRFYLEDESGLLNTDPDSITMHAWHPGYVDYYVYAKGDYSAPKDVFKDIRTVDVHALTSPKVKNWIREQGIELINMRDALYGTNDYQNHLRNIGSELAVVEYTKGSTEKLRK